MTDTDAQSCSDEPVPLALGYIRAHLMMTEDELAAAKYDLADCAERAGFVLVHTYVERIDQTPAAFHALMADIQRRAATAVVVPGNHHLAILGDPDVLKDLVEQMTGARVLLARDAP